MCQCTYNNNVFKEKKKTKYVKTDSLDVITCLLFNIVKGKKQRKLKHNLIKFT